MSIATKSISSYLPIRARTNRTRSWMALRTPYRWSACATTATSPNQDGVLGEFVGSTWMWTTGSVIFLSSLSHSFSLRKTHFCRLCQFFRAFFPSSAHSLRIPWAGDLLGATQAAPSHHDQQGLGHLRSRRLQVIHGGSFRFPKVGLAAAAVITLPASMAAIAHHM